nr:hypothetical protein [Luteibacter rhizovicinus]
MVTLTVAVYAPGLGGGFVFDDFPNIVDNDGVKPPDASIASLVRSAMSSPSSEFKRPLASLSFAANYLSTGMDPFWMKATNVVIHLANGLLVFLLMRVLIRVSARSNKLTTTHGDITSAIIAGAWLLLPINLTAVLYVVQRMESLANLFVLLGLLGYALARERMQSKDTRVAAVVAAASVIVPTLLGALAKETAIMLPLYALLVEVILFRSKTSAGGIDDSSHSPRQDLRVWAFFGVVLALPMIGGLAWLMPGLLRPSGWSTRDFTMSTRLLSEARVVVDYIGWTLLPTPGALSFYHDDFVVSRSLFSPWTTAFCIVVLIGLVWIATAIRHKHPLISLGIALYLGSHLLTGTILPLELIYEHRNYFASMGLLLACIPLLTAPDSAVANRFLVARYAALAGLIVLWTAVTAITSHAWGDPLRLAEELGGRAPKSPRAQYELGRTYIIYSHYDPTSPFTNMAYAPLEHAALLPGSTILPEQALIFMNARMHRPIEDAWWDSLIRKLGTNKIGVQDESSLSSLTLCSRKQECDLPKQRMVDAFLAALSQGTPSGRLMAIYGDYAWNVLEDKDLGLRMTQSASKALPGESAYRIALIRMLVVQGRYAEAREQIATLEHQNVAGSLDSEIEQLRALPQMR